MNVYRLVTLVNLDRRVDEAFIITSINGQPLADYVKNNRLCFSSEQIKGLFYKKVNLIRIDMRETPNQETPNQVVSPRAYAPNASVD